MQCRSVDPAFEETSVVSSESMTAKIPFWDIGPDPLSTSIGAIWKSYIHSLLGYFVLRDFSGARALVDQEN
jgi:hypothetical protein